MPLHQARVEVRACERPDRIELQGLDHLEPANQRFLKQRRLEKQKTQVLKYAKLPEIERSADRLNSQSVSSVNVPDGVYEHCAIEGLFKNAMLGWRLQKQREGDVCRPLDFFECASLHGLQQFMSSHSHELLRFNIVRHLRSL